MSGKRLISLLVVMLLGVSVLGACGGSDEPQSKSTAKPTATRDADGFTPDEREVVNAVEAYNKAFFGRGATPVVPAIQDFVTKKLLDQAGPAESKAVDKAGLQYIGSVTLHPEKVTIDGAKATFEGCQDGTKAFVVKRGETSAGVGSRAVSTTRLHVELVREHGRWLVDYPEGETVDSCAG